MPLFTFHTTTQYNSLIRAYAYALWKDVNQTDTTQVDLMHSNEMKGKVVLTLGCSTNTKYEIKYKEIPLVVEIIESQIFKGSGLGLSKWCDIYVRIDAVNLKVAETIFGEFVSDGVEFLRRRERTKISIKIFDPKYSWKYISELPPRPLETIYLNPTDKQNLINDIIEFTQSENEYVQLGIPYKRCYLLQGTPGSGKTSLIFAIASMLKKDVSVLNFSSDINDTIFISAISQLTSDDILVLEDLDALFIDRSPVNTHGVSFSALLNVLDGVCRKDGMITFITTNHVELLDPALKRPGRIDYVMKFTHATKQQIRQMYDKFRNGNDEEFEAFYKILKNKAINMSLVQKFLFGHRKDRNLLDFEKELTLLVSEHEEKARIGVI